MRRISLQVYLSWTINHSCKSAKSIRSTRFLCFARVSSLELVFLFFNMRNTTYDKVSKQNDNSYFTNCWNIYGCSFFDFWVKVLKFISIVTSVGVQTYFGA